MWIEINLQIPQEEGRGEPMAWEILINTQHLVLIERKYEASITLLTTSLGYTLTGQEVAMNAIWIGLQLALSGQEANLDAWGYIIPLVHEQREALYKYMLHQETVGRMAKDFG